MADNWTWCSFSYSLTFCTAQQGHTEGVFHLWQQQTFVKKSEGGQAQSDSAYDMFQVKLRLIFWL